MITTFDVPGFDFFAVIQGATSGWGIPDRNWIGGRGMGGSESGPYVGSFQLVSAIPAGSATAPLR